MGRFSEGQERERDPAEAEPRDSFGRGMEAGEDGGAVERRFSEGLEETPEEEA